MPLLDARLGLTELPTQLPPTRPDALPPQQKILSATTRLILNRNEQLNRTKPELKLATSPTRAVLETAQKFVKFQDELKRYGGKDLVTHFIRDQYNILWMEQILDIDPRKVGLALETKIAVDKLIQTKKLDPQYAPAMALGAFVGLEKLEDIGLSAAPTRTAIEQLAKKIDAEGLPGQNALLRHLHTYLSEIQKETPSLYGKDRKGVLREKIALDIAKRLHHYAAHAKVLNQSQGVEVEVLQRLEYVPPEQRTNKRLQQQLSRAERYGIEKTWLPRGIRKDLHARTDWHLTNMLGIPEDVGEKKQEWFEMSTRPTEGGAAQSTILHELKLGGFITEAILSEIWEKYSMHAATTFPDTIWNESLKEPRNQYVLYARAMAGAFASVQRGVYGGYVFDDYAGKSREIADKTLESGKFQKIAGQSATDTRGQALVEMRVLDLTESGQHSVLAHKPYLDYAFRCFWEMNEGIPLKTVAEYRAANAWASFFERMQEIYRRYNVSTDPDNRHWRAVGWEKAKNPQIQKDLASLIRSHAQQIRHIVDAHIKNPEESLFPVSEKPIFLGGKTKISIIEGKETKFDDSQVILSQTEAKKYNLTNGQVILMRFGETKRPAFISVATQKDPPSLSINRDLQKRLHIPGQMETSVRFNAIERELALGPLIGIARRIEDDSLANPFGEQTPYQKQLILAARNQGMAAFVFDLSEKTDNFDTNSKTISGITLSEDGKTWIRVTSPYPDVIFSRSFGSQDKAKVESITHIPQVNNPDFASFIADKIKLPEAICRNPKLKPYIPETTSYSSYQDLKRMFNTHQTVYLKPKFGMRSEGVIQFARLPDGRIRYRHTIPNVDPQDTSYEWPIKPGQEGYGGYIASSLREALEKTEAFRKKFPYKDYIVQEGIGGIPGYENGRPFELRFLFQRNATGKLGVVGWDQGQRDFWMPTIISLFGDKNADVVATNAVRLAQAISLQVQHQFGSHFGQYSIQIAVDNNGKPWYLEANPKPGVSNQFHYLHLDHLTETSAMQTMKLCESMAGFSPVPSEAQYVARVRLKDGSEASISEETNPLVIYEFAQKALGKNISIPELSVYNLRDIDRIRSNMAQRTKYYVLRQANGEIIGCRSVMRPKSQYVIDLDDPKHPKVLTKKRWEIGGGLTAPSARGKGVASQMFKILIKAIGKEPPVYDPATKKDVDEILVNITGTRNRDKLGIARVDSVASEKIVQNIPKSKRLGAVPGSYGPVYVFPITG